MAEYIEREAAINSMCRWRSDTTRDKCHIADVCNLACRLEAVPAADVREVVLCRDCIHYEMGVCLKIYDDGAANKDAWQERKPEDFCSYGEDRNVSTNCRSDMRPTSMSGANREGKHENRTD